jgi:toxin CcdB
MAPLVIRQFDVFENPSGRTNGPVPYIVVLQSHYLDALNTVVVAPLFRPEVIPAENAIMLAVKVNEEALVLDLALIANLPTRLLRQTIGNLVDYDLEIRRAIDRLLSGF